MSTSLLAQARLRRERFAPRGPHAPGLRPCAHPARYARQAKGRRCVIVPRNCTRIVQNACRDAGLRVVRLHDSRHGWVSVLLGLGVPSRTAMDIAGHSTIEMTMNVYGHVTLDEKREALDRLGSLSEERGVTRFQQRVAAGAPAPACAVTG